MTRRGAASVVAALFLAAPACTSSSTGSQHDAASGAGGSVGGGGSPTTTAGTGGGAGSGPAGSSSGGLSGAAGSSEAGAAGAENTAGDGATCSVCDAYAEPQALGTVADARLDALSGMAASWRNPGVLFVHNDRDQARFFAVSESGELLQTFDISGASVSDIEDIAVGPCAAGSCVYIADIGDNVTPRTEYVIVRVEEPLVDAAGPIEVALADFEQLSYSYPDGTHNGESLLADPATGDLFVISKLAAGMPSSAYHLPAFGGDGDASKVGDLTVPAAGDQPATAADAHPCGAGFLLRTNNTLYEFRTPAGTALEQAFAVTPVEVPVADEQQGEAVTYRPDGGGYYTTSEGASPPIDFVGCN